MALLDSSYESKIFRGDVAWKDKDFVKLEKSDIDYTMELIEKLEREIGMLEKKVDNIIVLTHHIGFEEMLIRKEKNDRWNFCNAFMGSKWLGEMLLKHEKVKYHICGHTHTKKLVKKEHITCVNPGTLLNFKGEYFAFDV
jgi:Icc-related predicted phosphoesterase